MPVAMASEPGDLVFELFKLIRRACREDDSCSFRERSQASARPMPVKAFARLLECIDLDNYGAVMELNVFAVLSAMQAVIPINDSRAAA